MSKITTFACDHPGCLNSTSRIDEGWQVTVLSAESHRHFCPLHSSLRAEKIVTALHLSATELGLEGPARNDFVHRVLRNIS